MGVKAAAGVRQHRQTESQESIGAHFQQNAGENDAAGGRRLDVRVREPGVKWKHGNLHREGGEECQEEPHLQRRRVGALAQGQDVERVSSIKIQDEDGDQEQDAACEGVEKKLDGGIQPIRSSPDTDQEIHRNQHGFPKHIEQDEIQRDKDADHGAFHHEQHGHETLDSGGDRHSRTSRHRAA